jgi:hypothetical protein
MDRRFDVPLLPEETVRDILKNANLSLSPTRGRAFGKRLNTALANLAVARIDESLHAKESLKRIGRLRRVTSHELFRKLKRIEAMAGRGDAAKVGQLVNSDEVAAVAFEDVRRFGLISGVPRQELLADLPRLSHFASLARKRLQGRMKGAIGRAKPEKTRAARHRGDWAMRQFFGAMNSLYWTYFHELPGVTGRTKASKGRAVRGDRAAKPPRGKYVRLVDGALWAYASAIPDKLELQVPGLRWSLRLSPYALHGYFRRTGISKLRRLF